MAALIRKTKPSSADDAAQEPTAVEADSVAPPDDPLPPEDSPRVAAIKAKLARAINDDKPVAVAMYEFELKSALADEAR